MPLNKSNQTIKRQTDGRDENKGLFRYEYNTWRRQKNLLAETFSKQLTIFFKKKYSCLNNSLNVNDFSKNDRLYLHLLLKKLDFASKSAILLGTEFLIFLHHSLFQHLKKGTGKILISRFQLST